MNRCALVKPALLLVALLFLSACSESAGARVRLATTTSTENSGLLAHLLPEFEETEGIEVQVIAVGTGQALALGRRGDADLVLVHARGREDEFVAEGHGTERRDVMWNDFVIAGPATDPVGLAGTRDAIGALEKIRAARAPFVSRGDASGTHTREQLLWGGTKGGKAPAGEEYYLEAGQGMGACLIMADERRAYILTDHGTLLAFQDRLELSVLVEGYEALRNPYGVIAVNPERHPDGNADGARKLIEFLTAPATQKRIGEFRVGGEPLFHPALQAD